MGIYSPIFTQTFFMTNMVQNGLNITLKNVTCVKSFFFEQNNLNMIRFSPDPHMVSMMVLGASSSSEWDVGISILVFSWSNDAFSSKLICVFLICFCFYKTQSKWSIPMHMQKRQILSFVSWNEFNLENWRNLLFEDPRTIIGYV